MKIVVTGATGFLGGHLMPILYDKYGRENVKGLSSRDYDLMDRTQAEKMFTELQPEILVHLAAYSGGIGANRKYPADFYYKNTILTAHGFEFAAKHGFKKMIYTMGGCAYPATATSPITWHVADSAVKDASKPRLPAAPRVTASSVKRMRR